MSAPAVVQKLFDWKIRGIRWIEIIGVVCVAAMILGVYIAKAAAARESAEIGALEQQIAENRQRVRLLRAEAARLESPTRLEALSRAAGLGPVEMKRQAEEGRLDALTPIAPPAPVVEPAPEPAAAAEAPVDAPAATPREEPR